MATRKLFVLIILFLLLPGILAQVQTQINVDVKKAGTTPDSGFYFFDVVYDSMRLAFAFTAENRARIGLDVADERLEEMKIMTNKQNEEAFERARNEYENSIEIASLYVLQAKEETRKRYEQMLQVHIMAMQQIQEMTSIQNKQGIDNALQSLEKSSENFGKFGEIQFPEQNIGKEPCICTMEFEPVCGADGNVYSNACFAKCAGVAVAYKMSVYDINPDNPRKCNPGKKGGIEGALETTKMTAEIKQGESGGQAHEQADTGTAAQEKTTEVAITP